MSAKYRLLLALWGGLFLASTLILLFNYQSLRSEPRVTLPALPDDGIETENGGLIDKPGVALLPVDENMQWSLTLSTISAVISAAGFIATTYFALRSDRRQAALTELEIKKLNTEIERQKLEIEELRLAQNKSGSVEKD
jgi:hypothetical protein